MPIKFLSYSELKSGADAKIIEAYVTTFSALYKERSLAMLKLDRISGKTDEAVKKMSYKKTVQEELDKCHNKPSEHNALFLYDDINKQYLGFAFYSIEEKEIYIDELGVLPQSQGQGQGYGRQLIDRVGELNKKHNKITLISRIFNQQALHFYNRYGFKTGQVQALRGYGSEEDFVLLEAKNKTFQPSLDTKVDTLFKPANLETYTNTISKTNTPAAIQ